MMMMMMMMMIIIIIIIIIQIYKAPMFKNRILGAGAAAIWTGERKTGNSEF